MPESDPPRRVTSVVTPVLWSACLEAESALSDALHGQEAGTARLSVEYATSVLRILQTAMALVSQYRPTPKVGLYAAITEADRLMDQLPTAGTEAADRLNKLGDFIRAWEAGHPLSEPSPGCATLAASQGSEAT